MQGSEFRKRERRRLIEWFASKDIEKIEDAEFRRAIRPIKIKASQQEKEAQKQLSLLVLPLPRLARTQQHPNDDPLMQNPIVAKSRRSSQRLTILAPVCPLSEG